MWTQTTEFISIIGFEDKDGRPCWTRSDRVEHVEELSSENNTSTILFCSGNSAVVKGTPDEIAKKLWTEKK